MASLSYDSHNYGHPVHLKTCELSLFFMSDVIHSQLQFTAFLNTLHYSAKEHRTMIITRLTSRFLSGVYF